jgi:hypothetical protein
MSLHADDDAAAADSQLSANDLKQLVFGRLHERGVVDGLKTQLRTHILRSLKFTASSPSSSDAAAASSTHLLPSSAAAFSSTSASSSSAAGGVSLRQQVANALVAEYLEAAGLACTLSVFLPESGLGVSAGAGGTAKGASSARLRLGRADVLSFLRLPQRLNATHGMLFVLGYRVVGRGLLFSLPSRHAFTLNRFLLA